MICTSHLSNYYLCDFLEIIDNKKVEESDEIDNDMYILQVKRYAIKNCSGLGR
jgi:hypothetical protein